MMKALWWKLWTSMDIFFTILHQGCGVDENRHDGTIWINFVILVFVYIIILLPWLWAQAASPPAAFRPHPPQRPCQLHLQQRHQRRQRRQRHQQQKRPRRHQRRRQRRRKKRQRQKHQRRRRQRWLLKFGFYHSRAELARCHSVTRSHRLLQSRLSVHVSPFLGMMCGEIQSHSLDVYK